MRLAPRSLGTQAFLLIAALIVLSLAVSAWLFRQTESTPRARQLAQMVVSVVNLTRAAVLSAEPSLRPALLAEMAEAEGIRVFPSEHGERLDALPAHDEVTRKMMLEVRRALGGNTRFAAARNGSEGFWVSFFIGDEEFWVMMPRSRIEQPAPWQWLGGALAVLALALAGGALIARQVGRPLRDLAQAARTIGRGETPAPVAEQGTAETAAVAHAFNSMAADLAAIERERSLVLAGISHDLRTPLTRLRIAAEFIADPATRDGLVTDVEQMDAVVGQFLDYARLDGQETARETDLKSLAESVATPFLARAPSLKMELADIPPLAARPLLLARALSNLLDNAFKYGGTEIALRLSLAEWQGHRCARVEVLDRGPGIPAQNLDAARRPFVRLDAARGGAGSGLGLAIVERVARLHSGELLLEPRAGGGLAASLILPYPQAAGTS